MSWGRVGLSLTGLTQSLFCACLMPGSGFPMSWSFKWVKVGGDWVCWLELVKILIFISGYIQTHCQKNEKIKRADQKVYGTTLN